MTTRLTVLLALTLALVAPARAELQVAGDRMVADGWTRMNVHYWTTQVAALQTAEFVFEPVTGGAGLTARLGPLVSLRASSGFSSDRGLWLEDAHVRAEWSSGWGVTAGQFLVPLSLDAMILPQDYPLAFGEASHTSLIKPGGRYDVGVMGTYRQGMWDAAACVINGTGSTAWSGNFKYRKDLCGRIMVQPWCSGPWLGARIYRGIEFSGQAWLTWGAEAKYSVGALRFASEFQNHISDGKPVNSAYVEGLYKVGRFEPGMRIEGLLRRQERPQYGVTTGATYQPTALPFKFAAHYSFQGSPGVWSLGSVLVRVQAAF